MSNDNPRNDDMAYGLIHPSHTAPMTLIGAAILVLCFALTGADQGAVGFYAGTLGIGTAAIYMGLYAASLATQAVHPLRPAVSLYATLLLAVFAGFLFLFRHVAWHGGFMLRADALGSLTGLMLEGIGLEVALGALALVSTWSPEHQYFGIIDRARVTLPASMTPMAAAQAGQDRNAPTDAQGKPIDAVAKFPARAPKMRFEDIIGMQELKDSLLEAAKAYAEEDKNGILLFGPPGSGKTSIAEALAQHMGLKFLSVSIGDISSKWINESTQNLTALFAAANAQAPVVLFFDEIDALLEDQKGGGQYEEGKRLIREFLTQIVNIREKPVLFIGATNHEDQLDATAIREGRFDFKIEVPLPDAAAREGLIRNKLAAEGRTIDEGLLGRLVHHWAGFNVPRILLIVEKTCRDMAEDSVLDYAAFYRSLRSIQGRAAMASPKARAIDDLILEPDIREAIEVLAARLTRVDEIEAAGGSAPVGIALSGPPGTGKTTMAASLAKASGRAFISTTGGDLMKQGALDAIVAKASDLRPSLVFIDEGDDILANRQYSNCATITNKLLVLMDGASDTLVDVTWMVATNHLDKMDPAALRGGRLEVKIELRLPSRETLVKILGDWAKRNAALIDGDPVAWVAEATRLMANLSQADIGSILDNARNRIIARKVMSGTATATPITLDDLRIARQEVVAG